ncbi:hypothetical protein L1887_07495 [Cichorium endivia]|nr:hypothetical protein L1887_07495 [Cichorium endivia]
MSVRHRCVLAPWAIFDRDEEIETPPDLDAPSSPHQNLGFSDRDGEPKQFFWNQEEDNEDEVIKRLVRIEQRYQKCDQFAKLCRFDSEVAKMKLPSAVILDVHMRRPPEDWDDEEDGEWTVPTIINKFF